MEVVKVKPTRPVWLDWSMYILYAVFGTLVISNPTNEIVRGGLVVTILLALWVRWYTLLLVFRSHELTYLDIINSFFSHTIIFSALYMLAPGDYSVPSTTNVFVDSLFYSVDTVTTNGASNIIPSSALSRTFHTVNLLDAYLLLITLGYYIINILR
jgi:hypothetical protein